MHILEPGDLSAGEQRWLQRAVPTHMSPDPDAHRRRSRASLPLHLNKGLTLAVEMQRESDGRTMNGLIPIPSQLERFIRLRRGADAERKRSASSGSRPIIGLFISRAVPRLPDKSQGAFRVLRDSDIEIQEEAEDLVRSTRRR